MVGSGFAGLSAAIRLQNRGHHVTLIEKRDMLGGRAYLFEKEGFKFDAGPTVITASWLFDEIFESCGKKRKDYVEFIPFYKIFFENGKSFTYNGNREDVISEIRKFNPDDVDGYLRFFESTKKIFKTGFELIDTPFNKKSDLFSILPDLIKLRFYQSVYNYVSNFIKNEELRKVFSFPNLLSKTNWKEEGKTYKNKIISYLEKHYIPELKENIVTEFFVTPEYFLNSLNSYLGSAFSVEPVLMQSAFMRSHNESEDIENLYFCGAGTHPGAGLPGVLSSAKIVEKLIIEKFPE